jgi:cholesterol oxidase
VTEDEQLVAELELRHPDAVRLAECVSLAVYAEPALLRRMRHEALPGVDAGAEADLWFSDLVASATPRGIVLRPGVLDVLRERIASHRARLHQARLIVEEVHGGAAPIIKVEEHVIAAALDPLLPDSALEALLEPALRTMADPDRADGVVAWASRAIAALPERARRTAAARTLAAAASVRLGEPAIAVGEPPAGGGLEYLLPESAPKVAAGVRLLAGAVQISVPPAPDAHVIELPEPLFVGVGSTAHPGATRWVTVSQRSPTTVGVEEVVVRRGAEGTELGRVLPSRGIAAVACSDAFDTPDGPAGPRALAVAGDDGTVEIWDLDSDERLMSVDLPAPVRTLCFDNERFLLGALSDDGVVRALDPRSREVHELLRGVLPGPLALSDGAVLAATREGFVYRHANGSTIERAFGPAATCTALALRDGRAAAAYDDGWLYHCSVDVGDVVAGPSAHGVSRDEPDARRLRAAATALAWPRLPGRLLAVGTTFDVELRDVTAAQEDEPAQVVELEQPAVGVAWISPSEAVAVTQDGWERIHVDLGAVGRGRFEGRMQGVSADGWLTAAAVAVEEVELRTITGEAYALRPSVPDTASPVTAALPVGPRPGMDEHFDAIVVGSGFGGSVTAYRLAEAGHVVCVLERGKAYPPGSFARGEALRTNLWDPSQGLHGLFDVWRFDHIDAMCASGLGGGSLIYANVLLRKDEQWFVREEPGRGSWRGGYEYWPVTRADLDPHYERVERMMDVQKYPLDQTPYDRTAKTLALRDAARNLGLDWSLVNLAVSFANPGDPPMVGEPIKEDRPNIHGSTRLTCKLTGECDLGCNYGSKNTLDFTYLAAAMHAGAEVRTRCEVRTFEPRAGGGYTVRYVIHDAESEGHATDTTRLELQTVTCDRLVLAAGTPGTPYLLLRNRAAFPHLSPALGTRFSANGELLAFARNCREERSDGTRVPRDLDPNGAPVVTSAIRVADELDGVGGRGRGFYLEDAAVPDVLFELLEEPLEEGTLLGQDQSLWAGPVDRASMLPLLGLGRDVPEGIMSLQAGGLQIDWQPGGASKEYFERVRDVAHRVAQELGGYYLEPVPPAVNRSFLGHPLGGCPMGRDEREGVVDSAGRVFNHPGLHIADGSVMPGPVGTNPSLTIAALADRFADAMLEDSKLR